MDPMKCGRIAADSDLPGDAGGQSTHLLAPGGRQFAGSAPNLMSGSERSALDEFVAERRQVTGANNMSSLTDQQHEQTMSSVSDAIERWDQFAYAGQQVTPVAAASVNESRGQASVCNPANTPLSSNRLLDQQRLQGTAGSLHTDFPLMASLSLGAFDCSELANNSDRKLSSCLSAGSSASAHSAPDRIKLKRKQRPFQPREDPSQCSSDLLTMVKRCSIFSLDDETTASAANTNRQQLRRCSLNAPKLELSNVGKSGGSVKPNGGPQWRKLGPLKVSAETFNEVVAYRRSLVLLGVIVAYTLIALGATLLNRPGSRGGHVLGPAKGEGGDVEPRHVAGEHNDQAAGHQQDWTQEQIAGWYRENELLLADEYLAQLRAANIRIRECQARPSIHLNGIEFELHQRQLEASALDGAAHRPNQTTTTTTTTSSKPRALLKTTSSMTTATTESNNSTSRRAQKTTSSTTSSTTTTTTTTKRPKQKFQALNGCMFRRDASSDSLGDLCCCAGVPKFVLVNATTRASSSSRPPKRRAQTWPGASQSQLVGARSTRPTSGAADQQLGRAAKRKYLKPHLMCFVSGAGDLFNSQKLVAPLVSEQNLKSAHSKRQKGGPSRCIPCSCCHEHDPETVNKLLAGVPLATPSLKVSKIVTPPIKRLPSELERDGAAVVANGGTGGGGGSGGVWTSLRAQLVNSMQNLDEFFFRLYERIDLALFVLRFGIYPTATATGGKQASSDAATLDVNVMPLEWARLFAGERTNSAVGAKLSNVLVVSNQIVEPQNSILIEADTYDDFRPTTTTTTTTTSRPTSTARAGAGHASTNKPKRRKQKRLSSTRRPPAGAGSGTTPPAASSRVATGKLATTPEQQAVKSNLPKSTTSTKSPTVIINVYATGNNDADHKASATAKSDGAKQANGSLPSPASPAGGNPPPPPPPPPVGKPKTGVALLDDVSSGPASSDIKLHIQLNQSDGLNNQTRSEFKTSPTPNRFAAGKQTSANEQMAPGAAGDLAKVTPPPRAAASGRAAVEPTAIGGGAAGSSSMTATSTAIATTTPTTTTTTTTSAKPANSIVISLERGPPSATITIVNTTRLLLTPTTTNPTPTSTRSLAQARSLGDGSSSSRAPMSASLQQQQQQQPAAGMQNASDIAGAGGDKLLARMLMAALAQAGDVRANTTTTATTTSTTTATTATTATLTTATPTFALPAPTKAAPSAATQVPADGMSQISRTGANPTSGGGIEFGAPLQNN